MLKITVNVDCAGSPKKAVLRDLNIAYARADVDAILAHFSDDIRWHIVGAFEMRGIKQARQVLLQMQDRNAAELIIDAIIIEGSQGVISGVITPQQGSAVAFCDICQFAGAGSLKIASMNSFAVEVD